MKKWLDKPFTWRSWMKFNMIGYAVTLPISALCIAFIYFPNELCKFARKVKTLFRK